MISTSSASGRLKPDIVKFDAQWITRLMESGPGFALLHAMVTNFADQGIETVFEGIEEGWQLELAERSGASMVQGYVLARPEIAPTSFAAVPAPRQSNGCSRADCRNRHHRRTGPAAAHAGAQLRKAGVAAVIAISNGAGTSSFVDEIGIEIGIIGEFRLKASYQPMFARRGDCLSAVAACGFIDAVPSWAAHPRCGISRCRPAAPRSSG